MVWLLLLALVGAGMAGWAVDISCPVTSPGSVSVGIYDSKGRLLRTVLSGKKVKEAGTLTAAWDGKDDLGNPLPTGNYTYKGLWANTGWDMLTMMGNSGRPTYQTPDSTGAWGGVHGNVKSALCDASGKYLYLLWAMEEGTPALLKIDPKGGEGKFKIWGAHDSWDWGSCQALATDGEFVYVANNESCATYGGAAAKKSVRSLVWRVHADSGEYAKFPNDRDRGLLYVSELPMESLPIETPAWEMYADHRKARSEGVRKNLFSIAVDGKLLYCSLRIEHKIAIFDKTTAAHIKDVPVQDPGWLAVAPDGNILVVDGRQVKKMTPDGTLLGTVISTGLVAPYGMAVDAKGRMYITDQGTAMQVKVFSPQGKLLQTVGKADGRAYGGEWAKMRSDLLFPTAPAVTPDGNTLYVGEDCAPKRVAIYQHGKFADEWYGPLASGCTKLDIADEQHPEYVYQTYWPFDMVRYKVDYKTKSAKLDAVWGYYISINGQEARDMCGRQDERFSLVGGIKKDGAYQSNGGSNGYIRHYAGKTYLYINNNPIGIYRIDGHTLTPCGVVGKYLINGVRPNPIYWVAKDWPSRPKIAGAGELHAYTWRDLNGDWEAQENETDWRVPANWVQTGAAEVTYRGYVDKDLNIYGYGWKVPCQGIDAHGNPIYSWSKATPLPQRPMGKLADPTKPRYGNTAAANVGYDTANDTPGAIFPGGSEVSVFVDPEDGGYYYTADVAGKGKGIGWAASGIFARVGKMNKDGEWIWMAGEKANGFAKPGQFYKPSTYAGIVHGCIVQSDWSCELRAFDKDSGLYVGSFLDDSYRGKVNPGSVQVELTEAHVFTHPGDGEDYALAGDGTGLRLFQLTGLKDIRRFTGTVTLAAPAQ
jgi:hypothetical protein